MYGPVPRGALLPKLLQGEIPVGDTEKIPGEVA